MNFGALVLGEPALSPAPGAADVAVSMAYAGERGSFADTVRDCGRMASGGGRGLGTRQRLLHCAFCNEIAFEESSDKA